MTTRLSTSRTTEALTLRRNNRSRNKQRLKRVLVLIIHTNASVVLALLNQGPIVRGARLHLDG
jgi:hypothetical protein